MALVRTTSYFMASNGVNDSTRQSYRSREVDRRGLTNNPKNILEWRNPSAYDALYETVESPHVANVKYVYTFQGRPTTFYVKKLQSHQGGRMYDLFRGYRLTEAERNEVLARARNNVANRTASLSESVLEMRSTARGLGQNAVVLNRFIGHAVRRDWKGALRTIGVNPNARKSRRATRRVIEAGGTFGSAWLNYSFGLMPIVSDMVSAAAYLSNNEVHRRLRVKGSSQKMFPRSTIVTTTRHNRGSNPYLYDRVRHTSHQTSFREVGCRYSLHFDIDSAGLALFTKYGGSDGAQALWAVVPWSFAVDWVLPVSEILRSNSATRGLRYRSGTLSVIKRGIIETDSSAFTPYNSRTVSDIEAETQPGRKRGTHLVRTTLRSQPFVSSLWIKDPFDMWKAGTSMALLFSNLKSALSR